MYDYLIVGFGLGGSALAAEAEVRGKTFVVMDKGGPSASRTAAGIANPVVVKRLKRVWNAPLFLDAAIEHYQQLESNLGIDLFTTIDLYRRFNSAQEQNNWFVASDRQELKPYLSASLITDSIEGMTAPFDYGAVKQARRLAVTNLLDAHQKYLEERECFMRATFTPDKISYTKRGIAYGDIEAKRIIYATGINFLDSEIFADVPLVPSKGDYLFVGSTGLNTEAIINAGMFIVPEGEGIFRIGATYEKESYWANSEHGREMIEAVLKKLRVPYKITDQTSGVRPTVPDRKPIVGKIPGAAHSYMLNGLGSRGVLMAPALARALFDLMEDGKPVWAEIDPGRFTG